MGGFNPTFFIEQDRQQEMEEIQRAVIVAHLSGDDPRLMAPEIAKLVADYVVKQPAAENKENTEPKLLPHV